MSRTYHNIEKSRGVYLGWDNEGNRYRIVKDGPRRDRGSWWIYPQDKGGIPTFYAGTLALVSLRLENRTAICAMKRTTSAFDER